MLRRPSKINTRGLPTGQTLQAYLNTIAAHPLLSAQEEKDLALVIRNGTKKEAGAATDRYIKSNLRLVASVAYGYARYIKHVAVEDLIQEGSIGLMRAVEKFNPDRGYKFSTYASWWIRQAIMRASYQDHIIRTPIYQVERQNQVRKIIKEMTASTGESPSLSEVAGMLGISTKEVEKIQSTFYNVVSLDSPVGEEGTTFGDMLVDVQAENPENESITQDLIVAIDELLERRVREGSATQRDVDIIRMRFNFNRDDLNSLEEVGQQVGLTRERVRQILSRQLAQLRHPAMSKFGGKP